MERSNHLRPTSLSISALLNNPHAGQSSTSRPGSRDIPAVHLSPVSSPNIADFAGYMQAITPDFENFIRAKSYGLHQHLQSHQLASSRGSQSIFSGADSVDAKLAEHIPPSIAASSRLSFDDGSSVFSNGNDSPTSEHNDFDLSREPVRIPSFFSEQDFELRNPRMFDLVCEVSNIVVPRIDAVQQRPSQTNSALQDKLSTYMDTVETSLVDEIGETVPLFFEALSDLKALQKQANSCVDRIGLLREEFARLSAENADSGLLSASIVMRTKNINKFRDGMNSIADTKTLFDCLDTEIQKEDNGPRIIAAMTEFEQYCSNSTLLESDLLKEFTIRSENIKFQHGQREVAAFRRLLLRHLTANVNACDSEHTFRALRSRHLGNKRNSTSLNDDKESEASLKTLKNELPLLMNTLIYTEQIPSAYNDYRDAAIREAKAITKRQLPSTDDDEVQSNTSGRTNQTNNDKSNSLATSLRNMSGSSFIQMIKEVYMKTCVFLRAINVQQKLLIDLVSTSSKQFSAEIQELVYSSDLASAISEICQARIIKVLNVRSSVNMQMTMVEMEQFYELNVVLSSECEALTGQMGSNLQSLVWTQTKEYCTIYCSQLTQSLVGCVEIDNWQPVSVSERVQEQTQHLTGKSDLTDDLSHTYSPSRYIETTRLEGKLKYISILDKNYSMPISIAALIYTIAALLQMCETLSPGRKEATQTVIEVLRLYNSRSCQLILGAGATKSAGLERITAKHLASTSQALSVMIALIPGISSRMSKISGHAHQGEFDKIEKVRNAQ